MATPEALETAEDLDDEAMRRRPSRRTRTLTRAISGYQVRFGVHSIQNTRDKMEDAHCAKVGMEEADSTGVCNDTAGAASDEAVSPRGVVGRPSLGSFSYFAVFDGHSGAQAAEFCKKHLDEWLAHDHELLLADPAGALRSAFARAEKEWHAYALEDPNNEKMDGTTAAVALLDRAAGSCVVGNVGDSEVLLGTRDSSGVVSIRTLTEVHHVKRSESEADRIKALGGRVKHSRLCHPKFSPEVLSLSVSRAIGDIFFKDAKFTDGRPSGLTAEPYITSVEVCASDVVEQFLLIGCDGLWDTVKYQEAADFVFAKLNSGEDPQMISEGLVHLAREAGSSDNI
eukprot:CAMPEP_0115664084 /NCGR_PEP_ID=MMETSP0272-20121206/48185_1 /TAXON_ID=71861 /ORGANISM="Scrippsiella trochoidea, Strain CCMP3099" /LENGTH=340 /DNA_ID=CAMNT_0003102475 /DNA_START=159 /DNA_END=1178 /DNA_ORIENTATION=+